jgi:hypothetical protein
VASPEFGGDEPVRMMVLPLMTTVLAALEVLDTGGMEIGGTGTTEVIAFPDASEYTAVYVVPAAGNVVIGVPAGSTIVGPFVGPGTGIGIEPPSAAEGPATGVG